MASLPFDSNEANGFKSISFAGQLTKLIKRLIGRLDSRLRTGPARVKRLKAEIVRLSERERVLTEENAALREDLSQLKQVDALQDVRQGVRRVLALLDGAIAKI